jgi:phage terminase small subunit
VVLTAGVPLPPRHLTETERECWISLGQQVSPLRVTSNADISAFESMVKAYAELVEARARMALYRERSKQNPDDYSPFSYKAYTKDGYLWRAYPETGIIADADRRFGFWLGKFGMTPADRSKVSQVMSNGKKQNRFQRFGKDNQDEGEG